MNTPTHLRESRGADVSPLSFRQESELASVRRSMGLREGEDPAVAGAEEPSVLRSPSFTHAGLRRSSWSALPRSSPETSSSNMRSGEAGEKRDASPGAWPPLYKLEARSCGHPHPLHLRVPVRGSAEREGAEASHTPEELPAAESSGCGTDTHADGEALLCEGIDTAHPLHSSQTYVPVLTSGHPQRAEGAARTGTPSPPLKTPSLPHESWDGAESDRASYMSDVLDVRHEPVQWEAAPALACAPPAEERHEPAALSEMNPATRTGEGVRESVHDKDMAITGGAVRGVLQIQTGCTAPAHALSMSGSREVMDAEEEAEEGRQLHDWMERCPLSSERSAGVRYSPDAHHDARARAKPPASSLTSSSSSLARRVTAAPPPPPPPPVMGEAGPNCSTIAATEEDVSMVGSDAAVGGTGAARATEELGGAPVRTAAPVHSRACRINGAVGLPPGLSISSGTSQLSPTRSSRHSGGTSEEQNPRADVEEEGAGGAGVGAKRAAKDCEHVAHVASGTEIGAPSNSSGARPATVPPPVSSDDISSVEEELLCLDDLAPQPDLPAGGSHGESRPLVEDRVGATALTQSAPPPEVAAHAVMGDSGHSHTGTRADAREEQDAVANALRERSSHRSSSRRNLNRSEASFDSHGPHSMSGQGHISFAVEHPSPPLQALESEPISHTPAAAPRTPICETVRPTAAQAGEAVNEAHDPPQQPQEEHRRNGLYRRGGGGGSSSSSGTTSESEPVLSRRPPNHIHWTEGAAAAAPGRVVVSATGSTSPHSADVEVSKLTVPTTASSLAHTPAAKDSGRAAESAAAPLSFRMERTAPTDLSMSATRRLDISEALFSCQTDGEEWTVGCDTTTTSMGVRSQGRRDPLTRLPTGSPNSRRFLQGNGSNGGGGHRDGNPRVRRPVVGSSGEGDESRRAWTPMSEDLHTAVDASGLSEGRAAVDRNPLAAQPTDIAAVMHAVLATRAREHARSIAALEEEDRQQLVAAFMDGWWDIAVEAAAAYGALPSPTPLHLRGGSRSRTATPPQRCSPVPSPPQSPPAVAKASAGRAPPSPTHAHAREQRQFRAYVPSPGHRHDFNLPSSWAASRRTSRGSLVSAPVLSPLAAGDTHGIGTAVLENSQSPRGGVATVERGWGSAAREEDTPLAHASLSLSAQWARDPFTAMRNHAASIAANISALCADELLYRSYIEDKASESFYLLLRLHLCVSDALQPAHLYMLERTSRSAIEAESHRDARRIREYYAHATVDAEVRLLRDAVRQRAVLVEREEQLRAHVLPAEESRERAQLVELFRLGLAGLVRQAEALRARCDATTREAVEDAVYAEKRCREELRVAEVRARARLYEAAADGKLRLGPSRARGGRREGRDSPDCDGAHRDEDSEEGEVAVRSRTPSPDTPSPDTLPDVEYYMDGKGTLRTRLRPAKAHTRVHTSPPRERGTKGSPGVKHKHQRSTSPRDSRRHRPSTNDRDTSPSVRHTQSSRRGCAGELTEHVASHTVEGSRPVQPVGSRQTHSLEGAPMPRQSPAPHRGTAEAMVERSTDGAAAVERGGSAAGKAAALPQGGHSRRGASPLTTRSRERSPTRSASAAIEQPSRGRTEQLSPLHDGRPRGAHGEEGEGILAGLREPHGAGTPTRLPPTPTRLPPRAQGERYSPVRVLPNRHTVPCSLRPYRHISYDALLSCYGPGPSGREGVGGDRRPCAGTMGYACDEAMLAELLADRDHDVPSSRWSTEEVDGDAGPGPVADHTPSKPTAPRTPSPRAHPARESGCQAPTATSLRHAQDTALLRVLRAGGKFAREAATTSIPRHRWQTAGGGGGEGRSPVLVACVPRGRSRSPGTWSPSIMARNPYGVGPGAERALAASQVTARKQATSARASAKASASGPSLARSTPPRQPTLPISEGGSQGKSAGVQEGDEQILTTPTCRRGADSPGEMEEADYLDAEAVGDTSARYLSLAQQRRRAASAGRGGGGRGNGSYAAARRMRAVELANRAQCRAAPPLRELIPPSRSVHVSRVWETANSRDPARSRGGSARCVRADIAGAPRCVRDMGAALFDELRGVEEVSRTPYAHGAGQGRVARAVGRAGRAEVSAGEVSPTWVYGSAFFSEHTPFLAAAIPTSPQLLDRRR